MISRERWTPPRGVGRGAALTLCTVAATCALAACGSSSGSSGSGGGKLPSTVTIGATLPLTGPGGAYGTYMRDGLQMAVNEVNATGGVHGAKLRLDALDDQAQASLAVSDTRQLLSKGVVSIASAYSAPPLAQRPLAARQQIPVFNGGSYDPVFLKLPYLWSDLLMSNQTDAKELQYAKQKLGVKKVAILFETDASAYDLKVTPKLVQQVFGTAPAVATVDQTATTVVPQLQKLLASHPDMLYLYMDGNIASLVYKELAQLNVKVPTFGNEAATAVPDALTTPSVQIYGDDETLVPTKAFMKVYAADKSLSKTQPAPNIYVSRYYTIGMTIAQALGKAIAKGMSPTGASVNKVLAGGLSVQGADGPLTYNAAGGVGGRVSVLKIESGKPHVLATYPAASIDAYLQ